jgi:ADP-ribosylglycohydrolase
MTIAVAEWLLTPPFKKENLIKIMQKWGRKYRNAGYGHLFGKWIDSDNPQPYGSFGNGSAMRVSAVGWLYDDLETARKIARWTAEVTHNHPEGVKGAEAIAAAICMSRNGSGKEEIQKYIEKEFGYDLSRTCDEIRPGYKFDVSCQGSVPEAIIAFLEGTDFEDVIRNAVSLGGDSDTIAAMAGSIAEAFYVIPNRITRGALKRLPDEMLEVLAAWKSR